MKNRMLALALAVMLMVCAVGGAADETASPETTAWEETSGESGDTVPETPVSGGETGQESIMDLINSCPVVFFFQSGSTKTAHTQRLRSRNFMYSLTISAIRKVIASSKVRISSPVAFSSFSIR